MAQVETVGDILSEIAPSLTAETMRKRIQNIEVFRVGASTKMICTILLDNGFVAVGESANVPPDMFDIEAARGIAFGNAFSQLVNLFAFTMAEAAFTKAALDKAFDNPHAGHESE